MSERSLRGCKVLVVEDEYVIADELHLRLEQEGAVVIGPAATVEQALDLLDRASIDAAILDVNLCGEMVFPVADLVCERAIPLIFVTGYDQAAIPPRFDQVAFCEKPVEMSTVTQAIGRAMRT